MKKSNFTEQQFIQVEEVLLLRISIKIIKFKYIESIQELLKE